MSKRPPGRRGEVKPEFQVPPMSGKQIAFQGVYAGGWLLIGLLFEAFVPVIVPVTHVFQLIPISIGLGMAAALIKLRFGTWGKFGSVLISILLVVLTIKEMTSIMPLCLFVVADSLTTIGASLPANAQDR